MLLIFSLFLVHKLFKFFGEKKSVVSCVVHCETSYLFHVLLFTSHLCICNSIYLRILRSSVCRIEYFFVSSSSFMPAYIPCRRRRNKQMNVISSTRWARKCTLCVTCIKFGLIWMWMCVYSSRYLFAHQTVMAQAKHTLEHRHMCPCAYTYGVCWLVLVFVRIIERSVNNPIV